MADMMIHYPLSARMQILNVLRLTSTPRGAPWIRRQIDAYTDVMTKMQHDGLLTPIYDGLGLRWVITSKGRAVIQEWQLRQVMEASK